MSAALTTAHENAHKGLGYAAGACIFRSVTLAHWQAANLLAGW